VKIDLASKIKSRTRLDRWKNSPVAWAADCMKVHPAGYQAEIMDALPKHHRVAVKGPHGLGKSFTGAVLVNWFATTRDLMGVDWKIITTASAWRHLEVYLWPEIHKWAHRIDFDTLGRAPYKPGKELMDLRLKLYHGAATAVASNQPERIEGAHARQLLYLLDEAKIVPPATWDSIEGAFSNAGPETQDDAYAFAMSTPGAPSGRFYDIHRRAPGYEDWWTRSVTLDEANGASSGGRTARSTTTACWAGSTPGTRTRPSRWRGWRRPSSGGTSGTTPGARTRAARTGWAWTWAGAVTRPYWLTGTARPSGWRVTGGATRWVPWRCSRGWRSGRSST
jgi:hypothetical protein